MDKYGCMKYIRLKQQVSEAAWDEQDSKWRLQVSTTNERYLDNSDFGCSQVRDIDSGAVYKDDCDILIQATGALNNWKWPNIPGLHDFKGKLLHSATWDEEYDYTVGEMVRNKRVEC